MLCSKCFRRCSAVRFAVALFAVLAIAATVLTAHPASADAVAQVSGAPPKVQQALELLGDPEVAAWLRANALVASQEQAKATVETSSTTETISAWLNQKRDAVQRLIAAVPGLAGDLKLAFGRLEEDQPDASAALAFGKIGATLLCGVAVALVLGWANRRLAAVGIDGATPRNHPARRLGRDLIGPIGLAVGSIGAFVWLQWPQLVGQIVFDGLLVICAATLAPPLLRFLLIGDGAKGALIPLGPLSQHLWYSRMLILTTWIAICTFAQLTLIRLGLGDDARALLRAFYVLVALVIGVELVWRQSRLAETKPIGALPGWRWLDALMNPLFLTAYLAGLWVAMLGGMYGLFWLLLLLLLVPWILRLLRAIFLQLEQRRPTAQIEDHAPSVWMVALEKLLKAAVLVAAGAIVLKASELGLKQLGEGNALIPRLVGAITQVIVIVFLADLVWHLLNAWINRSLLRRLSLNTPDAARREAKMRTLLPIIRNGLMVFITAVAAMMGLSAFGIEIGPLLAGAGIVGVAVGFGAQTIVKDIISGMFFLLDDAFRIGEYVQSGSYKGVVEGFSLRSVRLRHHRGALYTVPFSELGAIENLSRDWVIEKVTVGVTYDTDLAKVKKVVKEIGNELMSDPELSSYILETLKLQGVEKFGDFSVDLRMKIKTAPGDGQFMVKRRALALIKSKFARDGIQMPFPTVQVAGEKASDAATVAAVHNAVAGTSTAP